MVEYLGAGASTDTIPVDRLVDCTSRTRLIFPNFEQ